MGAIADFNFERSQFVDVDVDVDVALVFVLFFFFLCSRRSPR